MISLIEISLRLTISLLILCILSACQSITKKPSDRYSMQAMFKAQTPFTKVASFTVCQQTDCTESRITSAEILAATKDGLTLIYTDSPRNSVGFLDISEPGNPLSLGRLVMPGEPTSVTTNEDYALVVATISKPAEQPAGVLVVIDIDTRQIIHSIPLTGQPDSIAISPDNHYIAIAIENERDYKVNNGDMPQYPAGEVMILDISQPEPDNWTATSVEITGLASQFPDDPEPEYVDINAANQVAVTLQENNHLVVIDLESAELISHFSTGRTRVQITYEQTGSRGIQRVITAPREPDGASWLGNDYIVTADEGGYYGGTDTVTIFDTGGEVIWSSRDTLKRVVRYIDREEQVLDKGAQPENIEVAQFADGITYLLANIEKADIVLVYNASEPTNPELIQILDTPRGPEGGLAIPSRNLFIVASEEDDPKGIRSQIHIFEYMGRQN